MFLELLLVIVIFAGLYQYMRANGCGFSCQRRLADGARAGDHCPCACATCPCSPLDGAIEALKSIPETMYLYYSLAYEWAFKQRNRQLTISERERHSQFLTRPLTMATFEIEPSGTNQNQNDMSRSSTSRPESAEAGNDGTLPSRRPSVKHTCVSRQLNDEEADKIAAMCKKCKAKGVMCMGSCPNAKH